MDRACAYSDLNLTTNAPLQNLPPMHYLHPTIFIGEFQRSALRLDQLDEHQTAPCMSRILLPANVTPDDHVASKHGAGWNVLVDGVRHDCSRHREFDRCGVDDTDNVAGARGLEEAKEGSIAAVLGIELYNLLVVVGALQKLDAGVEWAAVSLEEDLYTVNRWVKRIGTECSALDGHGGGGAVGGWAVDFVGDDIGGDRELDLTYIADGNRIGTARGLDHGAERTKLAVLNVHAHLARRVIWPVPEFYVRVQWTAFCAENDLDLFH